MRWCVGICCFLFSVAMVLPGNCSAGEPSRKVRLDLKTKLVEKADLEAAKLGAISVIQGSSWAERVEYGEDYAVWLKDYNRKRRNGGYEVTLRIEVRSPAWLRSGDLYRQQKIRVFFRPGDGESCWGDGKDTMPAAILNLLPADLLAEACAVGQEVEKTLWRLLRYRTVMGRDGRS